MATGSDGPIGPSHVIVATKSAGCGMGSSSKVALLETTGELAGFALADEVGVGRLGSGELVAVESPGAGLREPPGDGSADGDPAVHPLIASTTAAQTSAPPRRALIPPDRITCPA